MNLYTPDGKPVIKANPRKNTKVVEGVSEVSSDGPTEESVANTKCPRCDATNYVENQAGLGFQ